MNNVLMHRNVPTRRGAFLTETHLTHDTVKSPSFGIVQRLTVDGDVYAQPLYAGGVSIGGASRNILVVATCHNTVYAFDADAKEGTAPVWQVSLGPSMPMSDFANEYNFSTEIGIVGTPAVDLAKNAVYGVAASRVMEGDKKVFRHLLFALDLTTGAHLPNSPVQVAASQTGGGAASQGGQVAFDSFIALQRTAMLLDRGTLWFGTAAHAYSTTYHGWLFAYDAATLKLKGALNTTSDSAQGGIWMSGGGPSVDDAGAVYVTSGNGYKATPGRDHQQSLLKFTSAANPLVPSDTFTVSDWQVRDEKDQDFGTTSATVLPVGNLLAAGDKLGNLYVIDSRNMGGVQADDSQAAAKIPGLGMGHGIYGAPVYWEGPKGPRLFVWPATDTARGYAVSNGKPALTLEDTAASWTATAAMPGGVMSLSANGTTAGTGILWAAVSVTGSASGAQQPGVLVALNAENLSETLYRSDEHAPRDTLGKFAPPTVADGKVFVATQSKAVGVYGLSQR